MHEIFPSGGLRVLVLSKRQYMGRDLLDDRYGRFRELPLALAGLGQEVRGLCLSYRSRPQGDTLDRGEHGNVAWTSINAGGLLPGRTNSYRSVLERLGNEFSPHLVWACSDVPHAVLGAWAAHKLQSRLVIDLYDDFESYPLARLPGVNAALRRAIGHASGVTCVSEPLRRKVQREYRFDRPAAVIENAIPSGTFSAGDKGSARAQLGLPASALIIGTAGALSRSRGTECLFEAFARFSEDRPDAYLVLAGPVDSQLVVPAHPRIRYLGLLPPSQIPTVLQALDISVICNRDTLFGRSCFPQKLYESLACKIPVAVARVGAMAELLTPYPENLFEPDQPESLLEVLRRLSIQPDVPELQIPTWPVLGAQLAHFLESVARRSN